MFNAGDVRWAESGLRSGGGSGNKKYKIKQEMVNGRVGLCTARGLLVMLGMGCARRAKGGQGRAGDALCSESGLWANGLMHFSNM